MAHQFKRLPILVSACLLGLPTRYDGKDKRSQPVLDFLHRENMLPIPVCPEQLAGLTTPRARTYFLSGDGHDVLKGDGRIISADGQAMGEVFRRGAQSTLAIASLCGCQRALLKEGSPSCGVSLIYRGDTQVPGAGVTTALLLKNGINVISEEDL